MNPLKQSPIDVWSIREKLSLASSVLTAGDQNWYSVSRSLKPFGEDKRPADWFSQKNCALQYAELLENVETPKRKRGERNEDTVQNLIVRKLALERINELKLLIENEKNEIDSFKKNLNLLKNESLSSDDFKNLEKIMVDYLNEKDKKNEKYQIWLKEREEKYASLLINKKKISSFASKVKQDPVTPTTPTAILMNTPTVILSSTPVLPNFNITPDDQNKEIPIKTEINDTIKLILYDTDSVRTNEETDKNEDKEPKSNSGDVPVILSLSPTPQNNNIPIKTEITQQMTFDKKVKEKTIDTEEKSKDASKIKTKTPIATTLEITNKKQENKIKDLNIESINDETIELKSIKEQEKDSVNSTDKPKPDEVKSDKILKNVTIKVESEITKNKTELNDKLIKQEKINQSLPVDKVEETIPSQTENLETSSNLELKTENQKRKRVSLSTTYTPTRRSGRVKVLRTSSETEEQKKSLDTSITSQVTSTTPIVNLANNQTPTINSTFNEDKKVVLSDETNDSTTSDVETFKTSHTKTLSVTESVPNSPASNVLNIEDQEQLKEYKIWKKSILLLWRQAATHKYSSLFTYPVTDEEAKGYSTVVYRPIDLTTIKKKIENGLIRTTTEFQRDIMLMFQNAIMYNNAKHEVHQMAIEMQKEITEGIEDFIESQQNANTSNLNNISEQRQRARRSGISSSSTSETVSDSSESSSLRRKSRA